MAETPDARVACPNCGKQYRWKPDLAGRKVVCKCGQKMRLPATADGRIEPLGPPPTPQDPNEASTYDVDVPDEQEPSAAPRPSPSASRHGSGGSGGADRSASALKCPSCNQPLKPGAVLCVKCGYSLESGQQLETAVATAPPDEPEQTPVDPARHTTGEKPAPPSGLAAMGGASAVSRALESREDEAQASKVVEFYLPLGLILLGLLIRFAQSLYFGSDAIDGFVDALLATVGNLVVSIPLALVGLIVSVKLLGVAFGPLGTALFKLMAILLGPAALGQIASHLVNATLEAGGWLAGLIVVILTMWGLLAKLFDLDDMDALYVLIIMFIVNLVASFVMNLFVLGMMFA